MSKRLVRKMLREMESGEPVELVLNLTTLKGVVRLALIAQEFGYAYADLNPTDDNRSVLRIAPDPNPEAQERAARNRARYPDAGDGGALPPVLPDEAELLKARMVFDLRRRQGTEKRKAGLAVLAVTGSAVAAGVRFGDSGTAIVIVVGVWAVLMGLIPVVRRAVRRREAKCLATLQAAGFTPVTGRGGRIRYLPPGGSPSGA